MIKKELYFDQLIKNRIQKDELSSRNYSKK